MSDMHLSGNDPETPDHSGRAEVDEAWSDFGDALALQLAAMVDPDEGDHLIVELPSPAGDDGCAPYAQFASFGEGEMLRAELAGNWYLEPHNRLGPAACSVLTLVGWEGNDLAGEPESRNWHRSAPVVDADELAETVVDALRGQFGVAHPHLLTYRAWGPASASADELGLCSSGDVPVDDPQAPGRPGRKKVPPRPLAFDYESRDELTEAVGTVLHIKYEDEPVVDADGDFVLHLGGQSVWVRVRPDQPAVEIFTRVVSGVRSRRATAVEIGVLNRDNAWVSWTLRDRDVWQDLLIPAKPFARAHLRELLDVFEAALVETRADLGLRTGGRVA